MSRKKLNKIKFESFLAIYFPVWVDQYGNKNSKTLLLAFQQLSSPIGTVFGYIITFFIKKHFMVN